MAGTVASGKAAAATNKRKYGNDFYKHLGTLSQEAWKANGRKPRGFAANRELASRAGKVGGTISRRLKKEVDITQ